MGHTATRRDQAPRSAITVAEAAAMRRMTDPDTRGYGRDRKRSAARRSRRSRLEFSVSISFSMGHGEVDRA